MKAQIDVKDRQEAANIRRGLTNDMARATVTIVGILTALPTDRDRERVLRFVWDTIKENAKLDPAS